jgi:hypothetical protein
MKITIVTVVHHTKEMEHILVNAQNVIVGEDGHELL